MSDDRRLHAHLIGRQGSRRSLNTPVLVLDRAALDRNIAAMPALAKAKGIALRPHAKTHKSVDIGRRQIEAGAIGLCCAKLGEAEALAEGGLEGLHITSPVVSAPAIVRLAALNGRMQGLSVVVDHPDNVRALAEAVAAGAPLDVLIDVADRIGRGGGERGLRFACAAQNGSGRVGANRCHRPLDIARQRFDVCRGIRRCGD